MPGSIALLYRDPSPDGIPHLLPGGVDNTFGSAANFASLINDVERQLFDRLPDETWSYPRHDSTLGAELHSLPEWRTPAAGEEALTRRSTKKGLGQRYYPILQ